MRQALRAPRTAGAAAAQQQLHRRRSARPAATPAAGAATAAHNSSNGGGGASAPTPTPTEPSSAKPLVGLPENTYGKIMDCVQFVRSHSALVPEVVVVLGSGLGAIADELEDAVAVPYADIPHFHAPGVAGHPGRLVLGRMQGVAALVLQGRFHYYEGHPMGECAVAEPYGGGDEQWRLWLWCWRSSAWLPRWWSSNVWCVGGGGSSAPATVGERQRRRGRAR